jgi:hypothetical protein
MNQKNEKTGPKKMNFLYPLKKILLPKESFIRKEIKLYLKNEKVLTCLRHL